MPRRRPSSGCCATARSMRRTTRPAIWRGWRSGLEAHLDGLRVAGEVGFETAWRSSAAHREPGEMFAAATLAWSAEHGRCLAAAGRARSRRYPKTQAGPRSAPWAGCRRAAWAPTSGTGSTPRSRSSGWLGPSPALSTAPTGLRGLARLLADPSPEVRARALRLVGELGRRARPGAAHAADTTSRTRPPPTGPPGRRACSGRSAARPCPC